MKEITGNIWDYHKQGHWIVITTNGFVKKNGCAVMGRGVARDAAQKFPDLPKLLGLQIDDWGNKVFFFNDERIITLPVKDNWYEKARLDLIEWRIRDLKDWVDEILSSPKNKEIEVPLTTPIYLVRPGCGNGGLDWSVVKPICEKYLDDRFVIVEKDK